MIRLDLNSVNQEQRLLENKNIRGVIIIEGIAPAW